MVTGRRIWSCRGWFDPDRNMIGPERTPLRAFFISGPPGIMALRRPFILPKMSRGRPQAGGRAPARHFGLRRASQSCQAEGEPRKALMSEVPRTPGTTPVPVHCQKVQCVPG